MEVYYKLNDMETVAMDDGKTAYIFDHETGKWVVDTNRLLSDRLHNTDGLSLGRCEQISKDEAQQFIGIEEDHIE
jgi:hypothetical protein